MRRHLLFRYVICLCWRLLYLELHFTGCRAMTPIYLISWYIIIRFLSLKIIHLQIASLHVWVDSIGHHHMIDWIVYQIINIALSMRDSRTLGTCYYHSVLSISTIITLALILNLLSVNLLFMRGEDLSGGCHS
jgi:hypothetical protein